MVQTYPAADMLTHQFHCRATNHSYLRSGLQLELKRNVGSELQFKTMEEFALLGATNLFDRVFASLQ